MLFLLFYLVAHSCCRLMWKELKGKNCKICQKKLVYCVELIIAQREQKLKLNWICFFFVHLFSIVCFPIKTTTK